jgi:hypothetical protein
VAAVVRPEPDCMEEQAAKITDRPITKDMARYIRLLRFMITPICIIPNYPNSFNGARHCDSCHIVRSIIK